ncbi:MAG: ABC-F family ATP-binding cassette domain-containing protein [bacterium]|nr:ABC transporter [Deltaproteobacteria bacterium]MCP4908278.1 ABC-F family ATP-binding cassette domain-containing protein [bacterium]
MPVLDAHELRRFVAGRTLFEDVQLTIRRSERVGLVGKNGSGKSTLARVLAGLEESDGGRVSYRREATIAYLPQEPDFEPGRSVREVVLESLTEWSATRRRYDELTEALSTADDPSQQSRLAAEQAEIGEALERHGGWEREHEAEATVGHLGIVDSSRLVDTLSGGEARRVALARLLVAEPSLAILDEPTNHLDIATIEWLEEYLRDRFKGAILLISHDRRVLDAVTTRTLEIHDGRIDSYDGGYARYLLGKAEREAHADRTWRNTQNFLRREVEWLRRAPKARGTKQKARISRAEAALEERAPEVDRQADLRMRSERLGKTILDIKDLSIERDGKRLIEGLELALRAGDRIGIVGPNGSGKTSLLLAILEELEPMGGQIIRGVNTQIGYLDQARSELEPSASLREAAVGDATEIAIGDERLSVGSYLERFLFDRRQQRLRVGELSGGERARVCLARLLAKRCNLILLDEPTNDLDVATLGALEAMLLDFGGSIILVSHDRWLLDRVATGILAFEGEGRVEYFVGDYSDFRERADRKGSGAPASAAKKSNPASVASVTSLAPGSAESRARPKKLSHKERRELDGLLESVEAAEGITAALQARLADPQTYRLPHEEIAELQSELAIAEAEALRLTERWEDLEARNAAFEASQR